MFGFPFFTSLIVVLAGVIGLSLIVNKGLAKHRSEKMSTESDKPLTGSHQL